MTVWYVGGPPISVSLSQAIQYAEAAGFTGDGLVNAVAIAMAESGLKANSANDTTSGNGIDRGIVKFNSVFHPEVSDTCAYDPACAFKEFFRVSQGGTDFCAWCTYNANCAHPCNSNGPYKQNLTAVRAAIASTPGVVPTGNIGSGIVGSFLPQTVMDWLGNPMRIAKLVVGMLLVVVALALLVMPGAEDKAQQFIKENPEVLAA